MEPFVIEAFRIIYQSDLWFKNKNPTPVFLVLDLVNLDGLPCVCLIYDDDL